MAENKFYVGAVTQASDFIVVKKFLINYIQKTYDYGDDIGEALLRDREPDMRKWFPEQMESDEVDQVKAGKENKRLEWLYREELKTYQTRKTTYERNKKKAFSFLIGQCAKNMQNALESRDDFESTIYNDPFELLKAIRQEALSFNKSKYEMAAVHSTLKTFMNLRQKDGESLLDYSERFKASRDVLKSHLGGPIILTKYVMQMSGYDPNDASANVGLMDAAYEEFVAYTFLEGADKSKYGKMMDTLGDLYSLKNDQYPKDLEDAITALKAHKFDEKYIEEKKKKKEKEREKDNKSQQDFEPLELSFANMENRCYICGKVGHTSKFCRLKDKIHRDNWAANKAARNDFKKQSHAQPASAVADTKDPPMAEAVVTEKSSDTKEGNVGWFYGKVKVSMMNQQRSWDDMKRVILLDNQSSENVFSNPELVNSIRTSKTTLSLATNAGVLKTREVATVPTYGEVWFNEKAITNIFSLAKMAEKYKVEFDSTKEDAFIVHMGDHKIKFKKTRNNLYVFVPTIYRNQPNGVIDNMTAPSKPTIMMQANYQLYLSTIQENMKMFTTREIINAKKARGLYQTLGTPSINDFKAIVRSNTIKGCPVTLEHINTAE